MSRKVLFQTIQICISTQFSSTGPIDRVDLGVVAIKVYSTFSYLPIRFLVTYRGHSFDRGGYYSVEKQSMYSTSPADWVIDSRRKKFN